jgi:HAD superfamily hydrolase (TIGR01549 family)
MPAQAVLFDIDGTLVDSVDLHAKAWQEAFERFGKVIPFERIRSQIGKGGDQLMKEFLSPEELDRFGEELDAFRSDLYKRTYLGQVRAFPRVRELFQELRRRGIRIALASSAKGDELAAYKKIAGIEDLVDAETSADDAERTKPDPDIFEAALEYLENVDKTLTLVVGDSPWDAIAARKLSLRTIGVLCGGFPETELRKAGCIAIYRDPADLLDRLDESPIMRS